MRLNPVSNNVYVFVNRRRTQIKLLKWEGDGFSLYYKRLEKGTFELQVAENNSSHIRISRRQLKMIFEGISLKRNYRHKRYQHI
jgi:transposase